MPVRTISTRLAITGDAEWRSKMASVNSTLGATKSQLKLVQSEYQNNQNSITALSATHDALKNVQAAQVQQIKTLEGALRNARAAQESYAAQQAALRDKLQANQSALDGLGSSAIKGGQMWNKYAQEVDDAERELTELRKAGGDTSAQQEELEQQIQTTRAKMEALDKSTGGAARQAAVLLTEQKELKTGLQEATAGEEAAARGVAGYEKQLNNAKIQLNNTNAALQQNEKYLNEAKSSADKCATSIDEFGKRTKDAGEKGTVAIDELSQALAATGLVAGIKALTDAMGDCYEASAAFEYGMAKVETLADTSSAAWATMGNDITALSNKYGVAASDIAEAGYQALSAAVDTSDAIKFLDASSMLSIGGYTSAASAVDILTTVLNAYGMEAQKVGHVADVLINTQNLGKTSVDQLASSLGQAIPTAAAYSVNFENLSAAVAIMTQRGINTANAITYLNSSMTELADDGSRVAAILRDRTGKSFSELSASGYSLGDVMAILMDTVNSDTTAFANLWGNVRAGRAALSIVQAGTEEYDRVLGIMANTSGTAAAAYEIMANTGQMAGARLEAAATTFNAAVGNVYAPAVNEFKNAGAAALNIMTGIVDGNPQLVAVFTGAAVTLGGVALAITGVAAASKIASASVALLNAAMDFNPVLLAIGATAAAMAGVVTVITLMESETQKLHDEVEDLNDSIRESSDAYHTLIQDNKDAALHNRELAVSLRDLIEQENKDDATKARICSIVAELNQAVPNLALAYDDVTESINLTSDELDRLIAAQEVQSQYDAAVQRQNELIDEHTHLLEKQASAYEAMEQAKRDYGENYWESWDYQTAYNDIQTTTDAIAENEAALESVRNEINLYADDLDQATKSMENNAAETDHASSAVVALKEKMAELRAAYEDAKKAAQDSLESQFKLWDKVDVEAGASIDDLMDALESQISYWSDYNTNMTKVLSSGVAGVDELVAAFADGSTESAAYLAALANASDEELSRVVEEFRSVRTAQGEMAGNFADLQTGYRQGMRDISQEIARAKLDEATRQQAEAAMEGARQGVENGKWKVITAVTNSGRDSVRSLGQQLDPTGAFTIAANYISGAASGADSRRSALGTTFGNNSKYAASAFWNGLPNSAAKENSAAFVNAAATGASSKSDTLKKAMQSASNAAKKTFVSLLPAATARKTAADFWDGFINGSNNKTGSLTSKVSSIAKALVSTLKKGLGVRSPSVIAKETAHNFFDGFLLGSAAKTSALTAEMRRQAQNITDSFDPTLSIEMPATAASLSLTTAAPAAPTVPTGVTVTGLGTAIQQAIHGAHSNTPIEIHITQEMDRKTLGTSVLHFFGDEANQGRYPLTQYT